MARGLGFPRRHHRMFDRRLLPLFMVGGNEGHQGLWGTRRGKWCFSSRDGCVGEVQERSGSRGDADRRIGEYGHYLLRTMINK